MVSLVDAGVPIALIGAGGIGKTSIALALLDDDRIKEKFGINRRFIRCDDLRSFGHFLGQLSKVTGAKIEKTPNLTTIRPFLSSIPILLILDNAETILDPHRPEAPVFYSATEELSRIRTISLVITTRISTVPATCRQVEVPPLSITSAREAFYNIYTTRERIPEINSLLQQLGNHPLSIMLLATVAIQNRWDHSRLLREWGKRRVSLLQTHHTPGLSATIELSLSSPTFTNLGPGAPDILYIIAILPQGINENEAEWAFPTVPKIHDFIDTFCVLSLTRRSRGFVTTPEPLRQYFEQTYTSSLLPHTKQQYFTRIREIACSIGHGRVPPQQTQWLASENDNIDFLLSSYMELTPTADVLRVCRDFSNIAQFYASHVSSRNPLTTPKSSRIQHSRLTTAWITNIKRRYEANEGGAHGGDRALLGAALCNEMLGDLKSAIPQVKEALRCTHPEDTSLHARCHYTLARLLAQGGFFTEATKVATSAMDLYTDMGNPFKVFECHLLFAEISQMQDNLDEAKGSLIAAAKIVRRSNKKYELSMVLHDLCRLYLAQDNDVAAGRSLAWSRAIYKTINHDLQSGEELLRKSRLSFMRGDLEEAKAEADFALKVFRKIGHTQRQETTQRFRHLIEWELDESSTPLSPFDELPELWNLPIPRVDPDTS